MNLPKRAAPYILVVLLLLLITLVGWMFMALTSPEIREAAKAKAAAKKESVK
ncbi:MAG: hypothetical protein NTV80_22635 [Verrucomicrobia bacterium]|jgi:hypothetical protein|nr:hypothetical protein [Verrucomicrobiota bacterium]